MDEDGYWVWYKSEPSQMSYGWKSNDDDDEYLWEESIKLPFIIDWRLTLTKRILNTKDKESKILNIKDKIKQLEDELKRLENDKN